MMQVPNTSHPHYNNRSAKLTDPVTGETYDIKVSRTGMEMTTMQVAQLTIKGIPTTATFFKTREQFARPWFRYPVLVDESSTDQGIIYMCYVENYIYNGTKFFGIRTRMVKDNFTFCEYIEEIRSATPAEGIWLKNQEDV